MGYTTTFSGAPENPLSEGGHWENTVSATWNHPVTANTGPPTHAAGVGSTGTNDAIARLTDSAGGGLWTPDQQIKCIFWKPGTVPSGEFEGHLRMTMVPGTPNKVFTYEWDITGDGGLFSLVRWDGDVQGAGAFTVLINAQNLSTTPPIVGAFADGDELWCICTGPVGNVRLQGFRNGASFCDFTDTDAVKGLGSGNPGIGFDNNGDGDILGFRQITADSLGTVPGPFRRPGFPSWPGRYGKPTPRREFARTSSGIFVPKRSGLELRA